MTPVGVVATALIGAVLMVAGLAKAVRPARLRSTLLQLGLTGPTARSVATVVPAVEVGGAVVATAGVGTPAPAVVAVVAGLTFALVGVRSLRSRRPVTCSCFGGAGASTLGVRQLVALPAWCAAALLSLGARAGALDGRDRASTLLLAAGLTAGWSGLQLLPFTLRTRRRRRDRAEAVAAARSAAAARRATALAAEAA